MKQQSIIDEMKFNVHQKNLLVNRAQATYQYQSDKLEKRWSKGSSGLFKSLIEYYGEIEGKRKWACVIRNKRMTLIRYKNKVAVARKELREAKSVLKLALISL